MQRHPSIYFADSPVHGRGVFTAGDISDGDIIEICPALILPRAEFDTIHHSWLHDYYFLWGEDQKQLAIVLGFGSLYNHSYHPNACFQIDYDDDTIEIIALRDIQAGEEITFHYHGEPGDESPVWFDDPDYKR